MAREIRISPDGNAVAIRSDAAADDWNAWGCMHVQHGGHWSKTSEVETWTVVPTGNE